MALFSDEIAKAFIGSQKMNRLPRVLVAQPQRKPDFYHSSFTAETMLCTNRHHEVTGNHDHTEQAQPVLGPNHPEAAVSKVLT